MHAPRDQFHRHIVAVLPASFLFESIEIKKSPPVADPPAPTGVNIRAFTSC
jgi:hypothetical protein